ncbi:MAG: glycosyltransferase family 87 protein [Bacteroidota bacterium]
MILLFVNERFQLSDFNVYYGAAEALRNSDQVYGVDFGLSSGFYKYTPEALMPFLAFSFIPYVLAAVIYYIITIFVFLGIANELKRLLHFQECNERMAEWMVFFTLLLGVDFIEREFFLGNVNALILYLILLLLRFAQENKYFKSGVIFGLVLILKVHFVILLPYFLWKRQWIILKGMLLSMVASGFLFLLLVGSRIIPLHIQWLKAVQDHNGHLAFSPNTIYASITKLLGNLHIVYSPQVVVMSTLVIVALIYLFWIWKRKVQRVSTIEVFVLIALIPILLHTDTEHFMWSLPMFAIAMLFIWKLNGLPERIFGMGLIFLVFIPFVLNSPDIVGKEISHWFDYGGIGLALQIFFFISVSYLGIKFYVKK